MRAGRSAQRSGAGRVPAPPARCAPGASHPRARAATQPQTKKSWTQTRPSRRTAMQRTRRDRQWRARAPQARRRHRPAQ
eukprot:4863172-Prymnesium_polylepis.1